MAAKKKVPDPIWEYEAKTVRVIDGDTAVFRVTKTFTQEVDFGFFVKDTVSLTKSAEISFRFLGINAAEVRGSDKTRLAQGNAAKAEVVRLLSLGPIRLVSFSPDKYGRWLANVFVKPPGKPEIWVNKALLDGGFALPYAGVGVKPV